MSVAERRARADRRRSGRLAALFGAARGLSWPWGVALGLAFPAPWVLVRIAAFGFDPNNPFVVLYPGVALAAAIGGAATGAGAALGSLAAAAVWSGPPADPDFSLLLAEFVFYSVAVCALAEAMHRAIWRLGEAEGRRQAADKLLIATERLRLASTGGIGTFDVDVARRISVDDEDLRRVFGMAAGGSITSERIVRAVVPDDREKMQAALDAAYDAEGEGAYEAEYRIIRESDGAVRWVAARGQVYFEGGRAVRMIGVCRDVTDLRTAQTALREGEVRIRRFVERSPTEIAMLDRNMSYIAASRLWLAKHGRGLKSLIGVNHYALHPDAPERWRAMRRLIETGEFHSDESDKSVDADGRTHWLRWMVFPWTDAAGAIGGLVISVEDIAAQKAAEAALRASEEKFRNAFAEAAIGFVMAKACGAIVEANAAYSRLTGYTSEELKQKRVIDFVHPEDRSDIEALDDRLGRGEIPAYVIVHRYLRKDGQTIWVRESASMTRNESGEAQWAVNLVEDVTERKRIEDSAARTVAQLTAVLDGAKDAIISIDIRGAVQSINAAGERMFGYDRDEVIGRNVRMLMPERHAERHDDYLSNYLKTGVGKIIGVGIEIEGRRKDGALFPIDLAIIEAAVYNDLMFVGFVRDLSERRRIESRMDQLAAQRLTAIGGIAGALAHELNQPLAATGVYLETARRTLRKPPEDRAAPIDKVIARASAQVQRMGDIIGHLRDFVAHGEPDKTFQDLHAVIVKVAAEAFSDSERYQIALVLELSAERAEVVVDPVQIGQVLSNLVRNAREAVGDSPGGRIVISTALEGDETIRCSVADNGPGLAEAVKEQLFEPLTSTKANGMGVGLSISKSIVEAHYGRIWAEPGSRGGAVFSFTLPLAPEGDDE